MVDKFPFLNLTIEDFWLVRALLARLAYQTTLELFVNPTTPLRTQLGRHDGIHPTERNQRGRR